jgi:hypothetical protein
MNINFNFSDIHFAFLDNLLTYNIYVSSNQTYIIVVDVIGLILHFQFYLYI